jgi:asparagine synthase (glutamine-hydrolysing)
MSVIFGIRNAVGQRVEKRQLLELAQGTDRYAPDGTVVRASGRIGMGFQPYRTHERSHLESRPMVDAGGNILTLDGRLDNHADLCKLLNLSDACTADSLIVLAAFARWGEDCFSRFVGDWALALWSHADQSLYLARDHAGTRTLYFEQTKNRILWSTFLETFSREGRTRDADERFAACYLACQPIRDLTPYKGISAVPPAHYLKFYENQVARRAHWQWMAKEKIHYRTDSEYEEHFLALFRQSVERRTGPGTSVLAQLSGGMDSTSIVCMSDHIRRGQGVGPGGLVDTISYYDDSEPNWNERPYFTAVEAMRGRTGIHVDLASRNGGLSLLPGRQPCGLWPGGGNASRGPEGTTDSDREGRTYRVLLSGIGGDELLGGVPTPLPELADLFHLKTLGLFLTRSLAWCVPSRTPLLHMMFRTSAYWVSLYRKSRIDQSTMPPWLSPRLRRLCSELRGEDLASETRIGLPPSSISTGLAWWSILESQPHLYPTEKERQEYRYPYLDKDLTDFLLRVPREQLVRPGRRRSLMRRALKNIVPVQTIERRRKAFVIRGPLLSLQRNRLPIAQMFAISFAVDRGYIEVETFLSALDLTARGADARWRQSLMRTIHFEHWLQSGQSTPVLPANRSCKQDLRSIGTGHAGS